MTPRENIDMGVNSSTTTINLKYFMLFSFYTMGLTNYLLKCEIFL
ncbi:hypothetical protein SOASR016_00050 [Pectobacterium carotovorum subsp. carotovorum]|uniref:Uncharacterized protein n=1 Tax=Pectobacterium carotovorum subsp. carotovorum TaxID=555 RepID=A0ABQ5L3L0_PECCC|nr:hypothetical protein SOASR016_00050 [Pectobacterium carotovorum subsp. carotovorum]